MSARKTISNSFVVTTVLDGESAPYYFQEWFAWSNDSTTASVTTAPTIAGSWSTSIPAQGNYAYLWRKSIRYVWNDNTRQYTTETPQYFRMSGLDGTSIKIKGVILGVAHSDGEADSYAAQTVEGNKFFVDIPNNTVSLQTYSNGQWSSSSPSDGDAYTSSGNGHLYMYSQEAGHVIDLGLFQGQSGKTFYTHVAWATNVDTSTTPITVTDFVTTKSPNDTTHIWMGVLVDENSGQDSTKATTYTWSNTKGVRGNNGADAPYIELSRSTILYQADNNGYSFGSQNFAITYSLKVKGNTCTTSTSNISISLPSYVTVVSGTKTTSGCTINCASSKIMRGVITITITGTYDGVTYTATGTITVDSSRQGDKGDDAKYIYIRGTGRNNDAQRILNITSTTNVFSEYGSRGFVAARINRSTLAVSGITWFDVYGGLSEGSWTESDANANTARMRFVTYLEDTTSDYFLAVASKDAIGFNDAMVAKLREFGLGELDYTAVSGVGGFRTPFAFLGYKGLQQGYALYQLHGEGENEPYAEVMAYVSNDIFMSSKDGKDGARGKVGRFFYFGGTFDSLNESQTFIVNDAQAPYFEHTENGQKRYHVFNYDTNGSYTMAQMWSISNQDWSNTPWEAMTNDFKYIITEAIFGAYAHFGSFIINGDWAISQYGVIYDANGEAHNIDSDNASWGTYNKNNAYTLFNPRYPDSSRPNYNNFCPNFAVDGKTGETYQNAAHIRGEVHATSGEFTGKVIASEGSFTGDITAKGGSIGGFTIDDTGKRFYNSDWGAGIDIDPNDGRNVKIGKNAQGVIGTESAIIRAENTRTNQTYNTALYLNAQNGTYNYAFYGNGNGVLNGLMFGYKVQLHAIPSGNTDAVTYLNINSGSTIILNGSHSDGNVWIAAPRLSDVRKCLGINSSTTPFAIEFTVVSHAYYEFVAIAFRNAITETQNSEYPWLMDTDDRHDSSSTIPVEKSIQIAQGDVVKMLLLYDNVGTISSPNYEYRAYDLIRRV